MERGPEPFDCWASGATLPAAVSGSGARVLQAISRRRFLRALGATGIAVTVATRSVGRVLAADDLALASDVDSDHQWVMVFDLRLCDGCRECTKACQTEHFLDEEIEWIKVYELEDSLGKSYAMPVLCQQCENAPCTRVCPVSATYHEPDGAVVVDQNVCIGCRMCMAACPYDVRVFNWKDQHEVDPQFHSDRPEFTVPQGQGTVGKCALCVHRLRENKYPACLEACSMGAIYVGNLVTDAASNRRETVVLSQFLRDNDAYRFREELGTRSRVYYIAGHGQDLDY